MFSTFQFLTDFEHFKDFINGGSVETLDKDRFLQLLESIEEHLLSLKRFIETEEVNAEETRYGWLSPFIFRFNECLTNLKESFETKDEKQFSKETEQIVERFDNLHDPLIYLNLEAALTQGKSKDKALNLFINAVRSNGSEDETLFQIFSDYKEHWKELSRHARKLIKSFERFPAYRVDLEALYDRYLEARSAFSALEEALRSKNAADFDALFEIVGRFSDFYFDISGQIQNAYFLKTGDGQAEEPVKVCPRCQVKNPDSAWTCKNCSFLFPQFEEDLKQFSAKEGETGHGPVMTENLRTLFDAIEDFRDKEIDERQFLATVGWMEKKVETGISEIESERKTLPSNQTLSEEDKAKLEEIDQEGKAGLLKLREGLASLRAWLNGGSEQDLLAAMNTCQEATNQTYEAELKAQTLIVPPNDTDLL